MSTTDTPSYLPIEIYLGGSFDPVHNGHIAMLDQVFQRLNSNIQLPSLETTKPQVTAYFLPTARSPFKDKSTSPQHRLAMLKLACQHTPHFDISEMEIWQSPPTYTIDTLQALRKRDLNTSLIFIIGADNVIGLSKWKGFERLTDYAHLWIIPREKLSTVLDIHTLLPKPLTAAVTANIDDLKNTAYGHIYIDSNTVLPISSTSIREELRNHQLDFVKSTLPRSVYWYIMKNNLYQSN